MLYGYESMSVVLDAVAAAGRAGGDRRAVLGLALAPRTRRSAIGKYAIERSGDVSERRFAGYRPTAAGLRFVGLRDPTGAALP